MKNQLVTGGHTQNVIDLDEVMYFSIEHRIITAHCVSENIDFYCSMDELAEQLPAKMFMRISRFYIVSLQFICKIHYNKAFLKNGEALTIGRGKIPETREWIAKSNNITVAKRKK